MKGLIVSRLQLLKQITAVLIDNESYTRETESQSVDNIYKTFLYNMQNI